ncbi:biopolymer transporter ExbD [Lampropedia puyangensis]|uniref:Biopolymer transporter ExbD n=1 Tax=Lampropedia puyangensis TaxID=1330072 RepID=A0A4S8FAA2_9BURK|nr:biopolymer transporter ExbD [Lampropedia puyangensis]
MAFSNLEQDSDDVMGEINMVPLIDIMLVLLIIFIITVPVIKQAMNVELPQATTAPEDSKPETISLSIDQDGQFYLDTTAVSDDELRDALKQAVDGAPTPDKEPALHISGDKNVRYDRIARAMALANETGLSKIGFVTEPDGNAGTVDPASQGANEGGAQPAASAP